MRAQGWYHDPYAVHEDRWFSGGQPTSLVRDAGAESYDAPPPGGPPGPLLIPAADEQMAGGRQGWPSEVRGWLILLPPFLVTLPVAGLFIMALALADALNDCFDTCGDPPGASGRGVTLVIQEKLPTEQPLSHFLAAQLMC